jgi:predicted ester cyclase
VTFGGTHRDIWAGITATGRRFEVESLLMFMFKDEHLMGEKLYLDHATILRQLGATLA